MIYLQTWYFPINIFDKIKTTKDTSQNEAILL